MAATGAEARAPVTAAVAMVEAAMVAERAEGRAAKAAMVVAEMVGEAREEETAAAERVGAGTVEATVAAVRARVYYSRNTGNDRRSSQKVQEV